MTLQHWIYLITAVLALNIVLLLLLLLRRAPGSDLAEQLAQHKLELVQQQGQFQQQLLEQQHLQRQHLQQQQQALADYISKARLKFDALRVVVVSHD